MAQVLAHFRSAPAPCLYLAGEVASLECKVLNGVTAEDYQQMLARGWRRFGRQYFRPVCAGCQACVSIRVPVQSFQPTKSQRRALRKSARLSVRMGPPTLDRARIELLQAWHAMREERRGWSGEWFDPVALLEDFCVPHPCAREFAYLDGATLVGLGIVDETPQALSSVYFCFHPAWARLSLGVASVMREIEVARQKGLRHVYLGYRVQGCPSMEYKAQFRPHEILVGRPGSKEEPLWVSEDTNASGSLRAVGRGRGPAHERSPSALVTNGLGRPNLP
jgi:arginine-tRNA-protein transferase